MNSKAERNPVSRESLPEIEAGLDPKLARTRTLVERAVRERVSAAVEQATREGLFIVAATDGCPDREGRSS